MPDSRSTPVFTEGAARFFRALAEDNSREFFTAHRDDYDRWVRQPMERLLGDIEPDFGPGKVMRPNRDVRFAADKSPYKTSASMAAGEVGGVYLELSAKGLRVGGGLHEPSRDQLQRARTAIASHPLAAEQLEAVRGDLARHGLELAGPSLKTAPRGFDPSHPAIELLRLKGYATIRMLPVDSSEQQIRDVWESVRPLLAWVREHAGPASSWP